MFLGRVQELLRRGSPASLGLKEICFEKSRGPLPFRDPNVSERGYLRDSTSAKAFSLPPARVVAASIRPNNSMNFDTSPVQPVW